MTPVEAFRSGAHWLKAGDTVKAVNSLEYPPKKVTRWAQWKLGRMYAEGEASRRTISRPLSISAASRTATPTIIRTRPQARFVANAFVALGHYYLEGIPKTGNQTRPAARARDVRLRGVLFPRSDAQYYLARLYLNGTGGAARSAHGRAPGSASRHRKASARRRPCSAQCCSGAIMCRGRPRAA